jgi:glycosyltransferase involved in cell wall biosynthesis
MTSVAVRGDQMAEELGGVCLRSRYLTDATVASAPALVWIVEPDMDRVRHYDCLATPQLLDVINPAYGEDRPAFYARCQAFRYLLLNTETSLRYLGPPRDDWRWWVVPHHHCNCRGYRLPEERLAKPVTVGYLGQPEHLHDTDAIVEAVEKLGLRWVSADTRDLRAYETIDIGVAWTRPETQRDETRSNIKMTNFAAHGIPCVVCDYASYRETDAALGGGAALIRATLPEFLDGIAELARDEALRRTLADVGFRAFDRFSRRAIGERYRQIVDEIVRGR